jgi:hypothetical protein
MRDLISIPVLLDSSQSLGSTYTSPSFRFPNSLGFAIEANFTGGTLAGTFKLQACISGNSSSFNDMQSTSLAVSGAGSAGWEIDKSYNLYVRVIYTPSSGTGTLTSLWINTKQ